MAKRPNLLQQQQQVSQQQPDPSQQPPAETQPGAGETQPGEMDGDDEGGDGAELGDGSQAEGDGKAGDPSAATVAAYAAAMAGDDADDDSAMRKMEDEAEAPKPRTPKHGTSAAADAHLAPMPDVPNGRPGAKVLDRPLTSGALG
jgi:hypothetical protein